MRIGLFTDAYLPEISGVTTAVQWLKEELARLGHEAKIYAPQYDESAKEENGVFRFRARPFLFYRTSRVALPYNREAAGTFGDLDIVHSHTPFSLAFVALRAASQYNIPHVHTYHTYLSEYRHYLPRLLRPPRRTAEEYSALICNRCTVVTAPSTAIKQELLRYGVRPPIHVLPFGVNLDLYRRGSDWNPRCELKIREDASLLLSAGRLAKEKNIPFLLRVFARVHAENPRTALVIAGDGPERLTLQEQCLRMGLAHSVSFTGFIKRSQLIDLYKAADLLLFSSKTETQGLVLVEAMAGGTPVVAIGAMGVLDVIQDGVNGLFAPEKENEFARVALEVLHDQARYEQLRNGALRTAEELSSQNSTRRLLALFERCLVSSKTSM